jgi:phytoene dehydrogenase-like protein
VGLNLLGPSLTLQVGGSKKRLEDFAAKAPIDYIIVGSGLGGLTCASLLAKAGYRVLVLEQHDIAGGATHTFEEKGFAFDVGVHYLGERLTSKWTSPVRRLFDAASDGKLEWSKCAPDFDHAVSSDEVVTDASVSTRKHCIQSTCCACWVCA